MGEELTGFVRDVRAVVVVVEVTAVAAVDIDEEAKQPVLMSDFDRDREDHMFPRW